MSLAQPVGAFGIHSAVFLNRTTRLPINDTILKVLGSCTFNLTAEKADLLGGDLPYPWGSEVTEIAPEISLTFREYPNGLMSLLLATSLTETAAEASGSVSNILYPVGTSFTDATDGVTPGLTATKATDLAGGIYTCIATAAKTFDVYCNTDSEFSRNSTLAPKAFIDNSGKIGSIDMTAGGTVVLPYFGIEFVENTTVDLTVGDVMEFTVRSPNSGSSVHVIGETGASFQKVALDLYAARQSDGTMWHIRVYKINLAGMPFGFTEKDWSETTITANAEYDSDVNRIADIEQIVGSGS